MRICIQPLALPPRCMANRECTVFLSSTSFEAIGMSASVVPRDDGHSMPVERPAGVGWLWPILVLALCHAQAIASFQILNILTDPIKATLAISDTQYSLLQGLAV